MMSPAPKVADQTSLLLQALPEQTLLRIVTENARIGLVIVSPDRHYIYANATYSELLGLPAVGLVGRRVQDVLADVYEEQIKPRLDLAFAGERVSYELRKPVIDGERYFSVRYEPSLVDGAVVLVVVVVSDITERRQTQADSRRVATIMESSDDAIISEDLDGIITSWSPGAERMFGYASAEVVGRSIAMLIPAERQHEELHILDTIRRNQRLQHLETLRQTKSGRIISVLVTISPIVDATGKIIGASKVARDVSERKRVDEELRFQQAMLLTERELTLDGILVVDADSKVLSYNQRFVQMWGISADMLATRADMVLLLQVKDKLRHPERFVARVQEIYERKDDSSHDEVELTDGRTFDRYSATMRNSDGRYYGRVWYFRDVTEQKRAEAALRAERDRAQRYLDTAEVILLALDLQGRITVINRKGCELLGWTEAELLGRDWSSTCLPERIRHGLAEKYQELLTGDISIVEKPILTRTGEERLIEWRTRVLRDDAGAAIGTFSSGADITDKHKAQEALRTAEERMRFALQSAGVGIWDVDFKSGSARMSELLESQYGLTPGTFGGTYKEFIQGVHPEDRKMLLGTIEQATRSGADFSIQHRALWPDGTVRWLSNSGRIHLGEHGEPARGVGVSLDVTERHSLEERYHHAQKMEAVGRLAAGVAHDFNNLLTAILGYCQLLLADFEPDDPRRSDILEIHSAGQSATRLTRQLLAFSRKQIIEPTLLDLNAVVGNMRGMLGRLIGEDVKVVLELQRDLGTIKADSGQMEQIILNLAVNARDAMPQGGTLTIKTLSVELQQPLTSLYVSCKPGPYVGLVVSDTGTGMSPEVQAHLFEPFFTTKEAGRGTGLGLATLHGIVLRCGGGLRVHSEVGKGTEFTVYIPQATASDLVAAAPTPPVGRPQARQETVLFVEDADGLRELAKRMLERQGYAVLLAANAQEALQLFERHPGIDVLLTDVVMPGGSGPELTRRMVEQRPRLKVVYMSGYTDEAIVHHGVLDSRIAFLPKPFTAEALGNKIREVLNR